MSDPVDPTGGWAAATEATANASKEAIQASRELGRFFSGPAREVVGILEDYVKVVRFERRVRLAGRVRKVLIEKGMTGPTRKIPLNIAVPLLENATLREDDDLQEVWAQATRKWRRRRQRDRVTSRVRFRSSRDDLA